MKWLVVSSLLVMSFASQAQALTITETENGFFVDTSDGLVVFLRTGRDDSRVLMHADNTISRYFIDCQNRAVLFENIIDFDGRSASPNQWTYVTERSDLFDLDRMMVNFFCDGSLADQQRFIGH
jgi:hypothetical protein